jgi:protein-tyrosine-phosphatase/GNAT superfamily N-acetyltransferase
MEIRRAAAIDFDFMWPIFRAVIASGDTYVLSPDTPRDEAFAYWFGPGVASYVAEAEGRIVGMYKIAQNQRDLGSHIANASFMVAPSYSGRGVGRHMGLHALREARQGGFLGMQFNFVVSTNAPAVALWQSLGFSIVGTLPRVFRHAALGYVDAYVMYRSLEGDGAEKGEREKVKGKRDESGRIVRAGQGAPLFVCHANCCRSVLACYLYRHQCNGAPAFSAGLDVGERINDRAEGMLREWGIDASAHRPLKLSRDLCLEATAIFVMGPSYLHRLVWEYGEDLADKAYLFADPFTKPVSFGNREYTVVDPSFDNRPISELRKEFAWLRERVLQIRLALLEDGRRLVPLSEYLELCKTVDPGSH